MGKLRLAGCFETYLQENSTIKFTVVGLRNPSTVIPSASFELRTQDPENYDIEVFGKNMSVQASPGSLVAV